MYLVMARTGAAGPKGISAFLVDKVSISIVTMSVETKSNVLRMKYIQTYAMTTCSLSSASRCHGCAALRAHQG